MPYYVLVVQRHHAMRHGASAGQAPEFDVFRARTDWMYDAHVRCEWVVMRQAVTDWGLVASTLQDACVAVAVDRDTTLVQSLLPFACCAHHHVLTSQLTSFDTRATL